MLMNAILWEVLRSVLFFLPTALLLAASLFFALKRKAGPALTFAALGLVGVLISCAALLGSPLRPYAIHRVSGEGAKIAYTREVVLFGKALAYRGGAYPPLKRDLVINDTDCLLVIEDLVYEREDSHAEVLDVPAVGKKPLEIPPHSVYQAPTGYLSNRIEVDFWGRGNHAPPASYGKALSQDQVRGMLSRLNRKEKKTWLHWENWDEHAWQYRQEQQELLEFLNQAGVNITPILEGRHLQKSWMEGADPNLLHSPTVEDSE